MEDLMKVGKIPSDNHGFYENMKRQIKMNVMRLKHLKLLKVNYANYIISCSLLNTLSKTSSNDISKNMFPLLPECDYITFLYLII